MLNCLLTAIVKARIVPQNSIGPLTGCVTSQHIFFYTIEADGKTEMPSQKDTRRSCLISLVSKISTIAKKPH
jgi:hypothetical protein